jgi:ABC-type sugar transport system ATPase subunit
MRFAACMRQHGVPDWPDPKADGTFPFVGTALEREGKSPRVLAAARACRQLNPDPRGQHPWQLRAARLERLSAVENVATGLLYRGVPAAERRRLARHALERVGLGHRLDRRPTTLSGGERQRVAIARALVGHPEVVLADEPTGNLDTATSAELVALLQRLNREGTTLVVVTHDHGVADAMGRTVELRDGQVVGDSGGTAS